MNCLKPNTQYQIITINVAMPVDITEAGMADAINETLHNANGNDDPVFADWQIKGFETIGLKDGSVHFITDDDPQEGDPFVN